MKRFLLTFFILGLFPSFGAETIDSSFDKIQKSVQALEPHMFSYGMTLFAILASIELVYGLYKVLLANALPGQVLKYFLNCLSYEKLNNTHEKAVRIESLTKEKITEKENHSVEDLTQGQENKQRTKKEILHLAKQISNLTIKQLARISTVMTAHMTGHMIGDAKHRVKKNFLLKKELSSQKALPL